MKLDFEQEAATSDPSNTGGDREVYNRRRALRLAGMAFGGTCFAALGVEAYLLSRGVSPSHVTVDSPSKWEPGAIRQEPVDVSPSDDLVELVPIPQLRLLLSQLIPAWTGVKTGRVVHAFRLWGPHAKFDAGLVPLNAFRGDVLNGPSLTAYLLDNRAYHRKFPAEPSLLEKTQFGVAVQTRPADNRGQFTGVLGHVDDLLCACAEVKLPSTEGIWAGTGAPGQSCAATIADLVYDSMARFSMRQELMWSAEAFARYLPPRKQWRNRFNDECSFDDVVTALLSQPVAAGPCLGTHVAYALTVLFRIAENQPILSASSRDRMAAYLRMVVSMLRNAQTKDGFWDPRWAARNRKRRESYDAERAEVITCAGHHLEWIALAPSDLRPDRQQITNAIAGILKFIGDPWNHMFTREVYYLPLSHLARALCLMLKQDASVIIGAH